MTHYIYGLFEPNTNEIRYVGHTNNPQRRLSEHFYPNRKSCIYSWVKNLKKEGLRPRVGILEECSFEERFESEAFYLSYLKSLQCDLLNVRLMAIGHNKGIKMSEEWRKNLSISHKGFKPSKNTRKKLSMRGKMRKHSEESRVKMRASWIIRKAKK